MQTKERIPEEDQQKVHLGWKWFPALNWNQEDLALKVLLEHYCDINGNKPVVAGFGCTIGEVATPEGLTRGWATRWRV